MTNTERILSHNELLRDCIETAENLPDANNGGGGSDDNSINAFLEGRLAKVDCYGVTEIYPYTFYENQGLKSVRLANVETVGNYNFYNCEALETVDLPSATGNVGTYFCYSCENLKSVNLPNVTALGNYSFQSSSKIEKIDLPSVTSLGSYCFRYATKLKTLILRYSGGVVSRGSSALTSTAISSKSGYIYVPAALVEDYKVASGWSTNASQIRAIEDYPDICG